MYFPYSAFWLTGQWREAIAPPAPLRPPGCATVLGLGLRNRSTFIRVQVRVQPILTNL